MVEPASPQHLFDRLIARYRARSPQVGLIEERMIADGAIGSAGRFVNDHVAFRALGSPELGIASLEPLFLHYGYEPRDRYHFEAKHLDALWYAPPSDELPRIFVSELRIGDLPARAATIVRSYTEDVLRSPLGEVDLNDPAAVETALEKRPWREPSLADYEVLLADSEYAAWTIMNAYRLNHMTISVHGLRADLQTIGALNAYLQKHGFSLNLAGGAIKTSPDGLLVQSSTLADTLRERFADGETALIAGSYVEFAERRALPQFAHLSPADLRHEHRRDGFEAANADKIFESTDISRPR